jgi:hypothetical protein
MKNKNGIGKGTGSIAGFFSSVRIFIALKNFIEVNKLSG